MAMAYGNMLSNPSVQTCLHILLAQDLRTTKLELEHANAQCQVPPDCIIGALESRQDILVGALHYKCEACQSVPSRGLSSLFPLPNPIPYVPIVALACPKLPSGCRFCQMSFPLLRLGIHVLLVSGVASAQ